MYLQPAPTNANVYSPSPAVKTHHLRLSSRSSLNSLRKPPFFGDGDHDDDGEHKEHKEDCSTGVCATCGAYPSSSDISYYAQYNVPPIPSTLDAQTMTYYIYFNIFFGDGYGKFNQFVPQLMLGSALCNSTNAPAYQPLWCNGPGGALRSWKINAQYFFALFNESASSGWSSHAMTGEMLDVSEGDVIFTQFTLDESSHAWTLSMGVVNEDNTAAGPVSTVVADQPYMGLLAPQTRSWAEHAYNTTFVGSCWELYGIRQQTDYPRYMNYTHRISMLDGASADFWRPWFMNETPTCSYSPNSTISSALNDEKSMQIAHFDIFYPQ